jgi:hypothetical protein
LVGSAVFFKPDAVRVSFTYRRLRERMGLQRQPPRWLSQQRGGSCEQLRGRFREWGAGQLRDWFEFAIPTLTSPLLSATLNLDEPALGHIGGSLTYTVYGLAGQPTLFTDVTTSNPFASPVTTSTADDGTTISITLDSAALADIVAHQGGNIFIGGIDSGENSSTSAFDFAKTGNPAGTIGVTSLSLTTAPAPVPEPASVVLLASVLIGLLVAFHRKTRRAS